MKELLKESVDLWCRRNWLRGIDKEIQRRNRYRSKLQRSVYVIEKMVARYNELYPDTRIETSER